VGLVNKLTMVQVIPKAARVKQEPAIKKILPWLSFLLVIFVIGLYFIFDRQVIKTTTVLEQTEQGLAQFRTQQYSELEEKILTFKTKVDDVADLLQDRKKLSDFFNFLKIFVHPDIYFTSLSLNMDESEAKLKGVSNSFVSLGQQILAFKQDPFVKEAELIDISLDEEDQIQFSIQISLLSDKTVFVLAEISRV
jgi:Tfp pilus assembly protein PilN